MDLDSMDDSIFDDGDSEAFSPAPKPKAKPAVKKATTKAAPKAAPKAASKAASKAAPKKRTKPISDDEDDIRLESSPNSKKQKLSDKENDDSFGGPTNAKPTTNKTATERYQKLTQLEHIIKRPDTYIGSVEPTEQTMWVFNKETELMEYRKVTFVPGLYKIFDEILVNAADNKQNDPSMSYIKVNINRELGEISIENNGKGIPVEMHEKEKVYIPELVFGHLLAGSNFDDREQRTVGGRNGYGAKLCNVFSTEFTIECQDSKNGKRYKQTWHDNMSKMDKAKITSNKTSDFVRVTFKADFKRFGMPNGIDNDLESLLNRRVYDMAGTVRGAKVYLNGNLIKLNFEKYCGLYAKAIAQERETEESNSKVILEDSKGHARWEVAFTVSDGTFHQVSFVNSIATTQGGTHVNYISDMICNSLLKHVNKKRKGLALKANNIRNYIFIFVNCLITNPAFSSQTKEQLTTKVSQFGSKCELTDKFLKKVAETDAVANILHFAEQKADKMLAKSDGNKRSRISNAKLVDANLAGTKHGHECTLILTEGDSAKSLAVAGRAILDPDRIGVFPLRGKMLNVRDAPIDQITKNQEIQNIKQFLGLKHKQVYTDTKSLRYGHLMIMADQDHDGSHIKGLLINFLEVQYPSLLKIPGFFQEFITPIVKVWQGSNPKKPLKLKSFFTQPQYEEWKESHQSEIKRWHSKYFKGLGTSSNEDAQVYFNDLDNHLKQFDVMQPTDAQLFELAFSKKKADARKEWLGGFVPGTYLDHTTRRVTYDDFVNKELILFSMADNMRSIPSVIDGLKPGQRKVIYCCLKRNLVKEQKVFELAGYVSGDAAYHHGDISLQQTIVGLAQNFVGSNNVNCLEPGGNFGSRLAGGSDAASARYIFTRLSPFARRIFSPLDEPNLEHQVDDGKRIEPKVYAPVIPMILVNGADGIGTGWSTSIPNYHPIEIIKNLKRRMGRLDDDGEEKPFETMTPWFRGWKGTIQLAGPHRYQCNGIATQDDKRPNEVIVTELPVRMWTDDFKAKLEEVIRAEKAPSFIKDYKEFNDHQNVHFEIQLDEKHMKAALEEGLLEKFKLVKTIATSNLVAFDPRGMIRKYDKVEDILEEFYQYRMDMYTQRKAHWLNVYHADYRKLKNQARFVQEIMDGDLVVSRKKKQVVVVELRERNYEAFAKNVDPKKTKDEEEEEDGVDDNEKVLDANDDAHGYDYLLAMPIWSFTQERLDRLKEQITKKKAEHDELKRLSEKDLWCKDLDDFEVEWDNQLRLDQEITTGIRRMGRRTSKKIGAGRGRKPKDADNDYAPTAKRGPKPGAKKATEKVAEKPAPSASSKLAQSSLTSWAKPKSDDQGNDSDPFDDDDYAALKSKPAKKKEPSPKEESDDDDVPTKSRGKRAAATAASKSKAWTVFDESDSDVDDDDDDKMLGDVGDLVKGVPSNNNAADTSDDKTGRLSLYAMSRPKSSDGSAAPKVKAKPSRVFDSDDNDDTNYEMLAKSPHKTAKADLDSFLSDDDLPAVTKVVGKAKIAPRSALEEPKPKSSTVASGPAAKKAPGRPTAAKSEAKKVAPKKTTLSPAAKAYATKKGSQKAKPKKDDFDMSDENDDLEDLDSPPPRPAGRGRPGRAAAAKAKPVYVYNVDSEEEEEEDEMQVDEQDEEDDFAMDDSD